MDAAVVAQLLALGVQLHTCRLVRGDVLRHVPLEDKGADVTGAQVTVESGELPPALSGEVNGNGVSRHDVTMNGIKHKGDLPHNFSGTLLRMDAGRTASAGISASLHRLPAVFSLLARLFGLARPFRLALLWRVLVLRPLRVLCGWPPHGYYDNGLQTKRTGQNLSPLFAGKNSILTCPNCR